MSAKPKGKTEEHDCFVSYFLADVAEECANQADLMTVINVAVDAKGEVHYGASTPHGNDHLIALLKHVIDNLERNSHEQKERN